MTEFILASKSPRRQILLRNLIDLFIVMEADLSEVMQPGEKSADFVLRMASEKALTTAKKMDQSTIKDVVIIAADTIVVDGNEILGKPKNEGDAKIILDRLRGRNHQALSGITVYQRETGTTLSKLVPTEVWMREYSEKEIRDYIDTGDPLDKAGAYAIQNDSFSPVQKIEGCFANVMGMPLCHLSLLLRELNLEINSNIADLCQESIQYQCPVYSTILAGETEKPMSVLL
ncbi:MAG: Maf family protein, partial [Anaerolineales bacterium]|nr:Maf family protein [Anaerolineales bacterium]